ncbi:hypothetical protein [Teredinibacter haidensis]|uniref:hypothetical protein n=1 Tax=Teredinibacter haidensis TaxID=2731755 RepID=UPI000948ABFB|nr:hypothetical protein [Teredinibacter haidensis]
MAGKIDDKAAVAIKGYLVLEKDIYFLYSNFESANYKSDERNFFRVKIWIPENMDMERCSNKSVIIYGVKYTYIGAPGIDEVVRVSDLGQSESSCQPLKEPFNRFQQLKARIEAGRQNKP